jgi:DNA-binding Lrp family transcriptional regulator
MGNENPPGARLEKRVIEEIEGGLPLEPHPYRVIAQRIGVEEAAVLSVIRGLAENGCIKRYGVVVRHRELGYTANGMVVWDVPDQRVDTVGELFGNEPCVTLCYQRPRKLPHWRYNLFTMVHGRCRQDVQDNVRSLESLLPEEDFPRDILFSVRRFKQRGARYSAQTRDSTSGATCPVILKPGLDS